jgi:hypothetical protein
MDEVQNPNKPECYTPSESFRSYSDKNQLSKWRQDESGTATDSNGASGDSQFTGHNYSSCTA